MESRSVTLMVRYKDSDGKWKRREAARGANGRVKPGHVLVKGRALAVQNFAYELRTIVNRQPAYTPAGKWAAEADAKRARLEKTTAAIEAAKGTDVQVIQKPGRKTLKDTASAYISDAEGRNANEAAEQARLVTSEFIDLMRKKKKTYVDEIDRDDVFSFHVSLHKRGCGDRTVANKHTRLASWLRFSGIDKTILPPVPRYEEKLPTVYSSDETRALLAAADCIHAGLHLDWTQVRPARPGADALWNFATSTGPTRRFGFSPRISGNSYRRPGNSARFPFPMT